VREGSSQLNLLHLHRQPLSQLTSDLADIIDFFVALTICNTVVVSSPDKPRHKVSSPTGQGTLRSCDLTQSCDLMYLGEQH